MMFEEGARVSYLDMQGIVNFVCNNYLVISLDSAKTRSPARLLVYRKNYSLISELKI